MDIITALSVVEGLGLVAHGAELFRVIWLVKDSPSRILGGINFKGVWTVGVWLLKNGVTQDNFFELFDSGCAVWGPDKGCVLLCQFCERFGDISESSDKGVLVAKDAESAVDLFYCGQLLWPSGQAVTFCGVNADGAITDNDAQIIDRSAFEFAL
jgi:hypothetical protein